MRIVDCGADPLVRAGPPGPAPHPKRSASSGHAQADEGVGRGPGGPPYERGQSLVEGTLALLIFFTLLIGVLDCGQVLVAHQSLVERVRSAARWGSVHPWNGSAQIENLVLYNQAGEPHSATAGFLGMTRNNVQVRYQPATPERPDDGTLSVAVVNYEYHFFSPWLSRPFVNPRPVFISAPIRP